MEATKNTTQSIKPKDGQTYTDAIYHTLKLDIIHGVRPAGERLRIGFLENLYGVGPTPLREALQRLSADGLVDVTGNRGFTVPVLDKHEFHDLNIARIALEKEAIRLSITNGDDEWEAGIVSAAYQMRKADLAFRDNFDTFENWERANARFHLAAVNACGSLWLLRLRKSLHDQCDKYRRTSLTANTNSRNLLSEHADIAQALLDRDAHAACKRVESHYSATEANLK